MNKFELFNFIKQHPHCNTNEYIFSKRYPKYYQKLLSYDFPSNFKFSQKIWHFLQNDMEFKLGLCVVCGKRCKFNSFVTGYNQHCSYKCSMLDENVQNKIKKTCLNKYGVENPFQSEGIKQKIAKTNLEKYGDTSYARTPECREKMKRTCLERYGVEYNSQTEEYKIKFKETCLERYGVENPFQSKECKEKSRQTCLEKYGSEIYTKTDEYKERYKNTCQEKYGCNNIFQLEKTKEKIKQTCLKKYGEDSYAKTHEYHKKRRKRIEYNNLTFDSSWEVIIYQYCQENNISCEYQPNIQFEYEYNGKKHVYQPDFLINDKLYEVKGNHFFDSDKMINPFDRSQDELFESKHQCMIKNNVIILRGEDINNLKEVIF